MDLSSLLKNQAYVMAEQSCIPIQPLDFRVL